ncbi:hypothetical protein [Pseudoxanthomonas mexicana]
MFANKDQEALDRLKEEAYYERALEELSQGVKRQGLWLKAMTLSEGDENKARLKYIQLAIQAYKDEDHISARLAENGQGAHPSPHPSSISAQSTAIPGPDPSLASFCRKGIVFVYLAYFLLVAIAPKISEFGLIFMIFVGLFCGGLAKSIQENRWLYGICGMIPLLNLLVILVLFNWSNKIFKGLGYKLSFFGGLSKA